MLNFKESWASTHSNNHFTLVLVFLHSDISSCYYSNNLSMYLWGLFLILVLLSFTIFASHDITSLLSLYYMHFCLFRYRIWCCTKAPTGVFCSKLTKARSFKYFKRDGAACLIRFSRRLFMFFFIATAFSFLSTKTQKHSVFY